MSLDEWFSNGKPDSSVFFLPRRMVRTLVRWLGSAVCSPVLLLPAVLSKDVFRIRLSNALLKTIGCGRGSK